MPRKHKESEGNALPELKGGEQLKLNNGLIVTVVNAGRKARLNAEFEEPLYRLRYPAHRSTNGWLYPETVGTQIWSLEELAEITTQLVQA